MRSFVIGVLGTVLAAVPLAGPPAELKPETVEAYQRYVRLTDQRVAAELARDSGFLLPDRLPQARRADAWARLRRGELLVERMETRDPATQGEIGIPGGMVHHWAAIVFIPGATLDQTLALVQDYDSTHLHYAPDVARSKLLRRDGDRFLAYMRFYRKKVVTAVLDTEHDVRYRRLSPARAFSRSEAVRIVEIEHPGTDRERALPAGNDRGFLWRLDAWWRFEERDGGTYVESEAVSLSRDIPFALAWIVGPFVKSVPRESLEHTLLSTRSALARK
jgi:hypothetical protein